MKKVVITHASGQCAEETSSKHQLRAPLAPLIEVISLIYFNKFD